MERDSFTSLEPLKNLVNLKRLYIRVTSNIGKEPVDLMPLAGLTNMEDLSINVDNYVQENGVIYCSISSLSALSEMQKLQSLTLRVGGLTDISPLRELKNLDTLIISDVSGAKITDWSPVDHVATVVGRD